MFNYYYQRNICARFVFLLLLFRSGFATMGTYNKCSNESGPSPILISNKSSFYLWTEVDTCLVEDEEEEIISEDVFTDNQYPNEEVEEEAEDYCRPKCNLLLHHRICNNTFANEDENNNSWNNSLCPMEEATGCALANRFTCTAYEITPIMYAMQLCLEEKEYIRNCSRNFDCSTRHINPYSYVAHSTYNSTSCESSPLLNNVLQWENYEFLPISEIDIVALQPIFYEENSSTISEFYIKSNAIKQYVFDILSTSLFDSYMILLKDFAPCMRNFLTHHRSVLLYIPSHGYLIEFGNTNSSMDSMVVCTLKEEDHRLFIRFVLLNMTTGLSLFGLCATIVSIFVTKDYLKIPGVNLMNLCVCLIVTYVTALIANLARNIGDQCKVEGIIHVFSVLASLAWMNVMAFDIWHNLSRVYQMDPSMAWRNRSKWLGYWIYGWSMPLILCFVGCIADQVEHVPLWLKPYYSVHCWFFEFNTWGTVFFYHGPIGIIMFANLILFLLTAKLLFNSQRNRKQMSVCGVSTKLKDLFYLYLKLFLLLGFTWGLEIANMIALDANVIIVNDFINSLQGFFLFLIFACKSKLYHIICNCMINRGQIIKNLSSRPHNYSTTSRLSLSVLPSSSPNSTTGSVNNSILKKYTTQQSRHEQSKM